jgi:hypothetical protein
VETNIKNKGSTWTYVNVRVYVVRKHMILQYIYKTANVYISLKNMFSKRHLSYQEPKEYWTILIESKT